MKQLVIIKQQLKELEELKCKLQHLSFGENGNLESGKVVDREELLTLIRNSECSIKERLLTIVDPNVKQLSNLAISYSSYDGNEERIDKSTSSSEEFSAPNVIHQPELTNETSTMRHYKLSQSSTTSINVPRAKDKVVDIFSTILSMISDQEIFLNARWNEEIQHSSKEEILDQMKISILNHDNFCASTSKNCIDVHICFPDVQEDSTQTLTSSEEMFLLNNEQCNCIILSSNNTSSPCMEKMLLNSSENVPLNKELFSSIERIQDLETRSSFATNTVSLTIFPIVKEEIVVTIKPYFDQEISIAGSGIVGDLNLELKKIYKEAIQLNVNDENGTVTIECDNMIKVDNSIWSIVGIENHNNIVEKKENYSSSSSSCLSSSLQLSAMAIGLPDYGMIVQDNERDRILNIQLNNKDKLETTDEDEMYNQDTEMKDAITVTVKNIHSSINIGIKEVRKKEDNVTEEKCDIIQKDIDKPNCDESIDNVENISKTKEKDINGGGKIILLNENEIKNRDCKENYIQQEFDDAKPALTKGGDYCASHDTDNYTYLNELVDENDLVCFDYLMQKKYGNYQKGSVVKVCNNNTSIEENKEELQEHKFVDKEEILEVKEEALECSGKEDDTSVICNFSVVPLDPSKHYNNNGLEITENGLQKVNKNSKFHYPHCLFYNSVNNDRRVNEQDKIDEIKMNILKTDQQRMVLEDVNPLLNLLQDSEDDKLQVNENILNNEKENAAKQEIQTDTNGKHKSVISKFGDQERLMDTLLQNDKVAIFENTRKNKTNDIMKVYQKGDNERVRLKERSKPTSSKEKRQEGSKEKSVTLILPGWKLFIISCLLVILFSVLSFTNFPTLNNCDSYYLHVLKNVNPFSIHGYPPV